MNTPFTPVLADPTYAKSELPVRHSVWKRAICSLSCAAAYLLVVSLITVSLTGPCEAQRTIYSSPYPSTTYPSYPVQSTVVSPSQQYRGNVTYPTSSGSRAIQNARGSSLPFRTPTVSRGPTSTFSPATTSNNTPTPTAQRQPLARLTSNNRYDSRTQLMQGRAIEARRPVEPISPYAATMIQSARQSVLYFRRVAESSDAAAATVASENAGFAEQWADLAETHSALSDRVEAATNKLNATRRDFDDVTSKIEKYGLTPTVGLLLRDKQDQLDTWQAKDSQTQYASEELGRSRQQQLELEMVRYRGVNPEREAAEILADAGYDAESLRRTTLTSQLQGLLSQRNQWLEKLRVGYQDYQHKLDELDSTTRASAELTEDYRKLIDRHITWIRSGDAISVRDVRNLSGGFAALFDSRRSEDFGPTLERKLKSSAAGGVALLIWMVLISIVRWRGKSWLVGIGAQKRMKEASEKSRKVAAAVLTIVVACAFPSILFALGRWLGTGIVSESTLHAASGFYAASLVALMVEVSRQLLRNNGYLHKHVGVDLPGRQRAANFLTAIGFSWIVAAYAITLMGSIDHGMWRDSLARFGFIATMLLVTWTAHLALRPTGGFLEPLIARFCGAVIHRVRFVIYLAGVGFPLAMIVLSALGYGFTANELIKRTIITLTAALIAMTLWASVKIVAAWAWQMLTGTRVAGDEADHDRAGEAEIGTGALGQHNLELRYHLAFLCQCGLVIAAIASVGWLWIDVFPNVRTGNPVLWTVQDTATQATLDPSGNTVTSSVVEEKPITALHALLAAATLFVAFQLAKLLPAMFDALVLQRVSFDEGMEHFSLVLGRFLLFGVGCLVACRWLGVRWETIQWLAVGLTIGLGFGLQDMVRNLFGGLIVLFEKPARLGDLISVGDVTGRVSFQRLRTTILSDDDGRELIIPNKNFVSEEVVNWMGAGRLKVIAIEVAVSRDERPADICRTLQELVLAQPNVLLTPSPQSTLVCVGKRSQRIELRAWIEEDQDASRFRDSLLKTVRQFLREKDQLTDPQPVQPALVDTSNKKSDMSSRVDAGRIRRRSA